MNLLIDKLLNYKFNSYNELVKPNYRSISDPLFSWWTPVPTGVELIERIQGRSNMITIEKTDFDTRIYRYEPPHPEKKGCYLVYHDYLTLNVYLCIGGEFLIRLQDINGMSDAFSSLRRIAKRCYVSHNDDDVFRRYTVDFLQLYGQKDVRMLQTIGGNSAQQNIETIKQILKICDIPSENDLRRSGERNFNATWFNKDHGQISELNLGDGLYMLPFDDVIHVGPNKHFISLNGIHCLFFHMTNDDKVLQKVSDSSKVSTSGEISTPYLKRAAGSPVTSGRSKVSNVLPTTPVDTYSSTALIKMY